MITAIKTYCRNLTSYSATEPSRCHFVSLCFGGPGGSQFSNNSGPFAVQSNAALDIKLRIYLKWKQTTSLKIRHL